jgi:hypothetical protein
LEIQALVKRRERVRKGENGETKGEREKGIDDDEKKN